MSGYLCIQKERTTKMGKGLGNKDLVRELLNPLILFNDDVVNA
jgi:hypothetical protein